jgi:hypothetical protein
MVNTNGLSVIKFTKEQSKLIEGFGSAVYDVDGKGNNFYFLPFWFEKIADELYIPHSLDKLPTELTNRIKEVRNEQL